MSNYYNVSGELIRQLVYPSGSSVFNIKTISLTNIQKVSKCKVDLFIKKGSESKIYLLKSMELPIGATLIYDCVEFKNTINQYGLFMKLTDGNTFTLTGSIDVTGTNTNVPGSGTAFLSELSIGDEIVVSGETRTISSITSDTAAVVSAAWGSDLANDTTPDCNPKALVDVIIS
jgi:hypothetical protein